MTSILHQQPLTSGTSVLVRINQGWRSGKVLATLSDRSLVEYTMPNGTTALCFIDAFASPVADARSADYGKILATRVPMRPCTYWQLLQPWLHAVIDQSGSWVGNGSRSRIPPPREVLRQRVA